MTHLLQPFDLTTNASVKKSGNINEVIKAVLFFKQKKYESKSFGICKLVKVSPYILTFTNFLNPTKKVVLNELKNI